MRKIFAELGYSLPIPINRLEHFSGEETKQLFTYHIRPQDWLSHWMQHNPGLFGGWKGDPYKNFKSFWTLYQNVHGSHEVFQAHSGHLDRVVPLLLHGDEGRAVKRTNYFVTSIESPLGALQDPSLSCSCHEKLSQRSGLPSYGSATQIVDEETSRIARTMVTNYKGHSYLSRWLLFGVGGWIYKKHPEIIEKLLLEVSLNLKELFEKGVTLSNGTVVYAAVVSIKGDMDFHKKVMNLTRSYSNLGRVNQIAICHACLAGKAEYPFEDFNETPLWSQTCYISRPWESDPYLTLIPIDKLAPERALQGDLMHIFKLGIGRDIVGSVLIILLRKGFLIMMTWAKIYDSAFNGHIQVSACTAKLKEKVLVYEVFPRRFLIWHPLCQHLGQTPRLQTQFCCFNGWCSSWSCKYACHMWMATIVYWVRCYNYVNLPLNYGWCTPIRYGLRGSVQHNYTWVWWLYFGPMLSWGKGRWNSTSVRSFKSRSYMLYITLLLDWRLNCNLGHCW